MALKIKYITPRLKDGQFHDVVKEKDSIFLHHTHGSSAAGAVGWWNQTPDRVGTSLLVETNGDALQCFEINRWASHLGIKGVNHTRDSKSVGIEIVNPGMAIKDEVDGKFYAYPLHPLKKARYVVKDEDVIDLGFKWRGYQHWVKYTDAQVKTVVELCLYLVKRFDIKVQKNLKDFYQFNEDVAKKNLPGIWSHSTVRTDKFDIFPQPNLIQALEEAFKGKK